jgi:hypothetical protein
MLILQPLDLQIGVNRVAGSWHAWRGQKAEERRRENGSILHTQMQERSFPGGPRDGWTHHA